MKNSRIAFDVVQLLYEDFAGGEAQGLTVEQLVAATGYSGPTIRLVLKRLTTSRIVTVVASLPRRQSHALTKQGRVRFRE